MIQKNRKSDKLLTQIQEICQQSLGYFVQKVPLQRSNFPILQVTYTAWRMYSYKRVLKIISQNMEDQQKLVIKLFYSLSQKKYLPKFIQRVQSEMNRYSRGLSTVQQGLKQMQQLPKQEEQIYQLIVDLGQAVWQQQLFVQLIEDLIRLPYLQILPDSSSIKTRPQFATHFIFQQQNKNKLKKMANNTGKNIFNKALTSITGTVISKAFLIKINTLFGAFNPIALGATFGMSRYLDHLDKKRKQQAIELQLKMAKEQAINKINKLKEVYNMCLEQIQLYINLDINQFQQKQRIIKQLKKLFFTIFQQQWLQIKITKENDGWQIVLLEQKQSFQQL